jgi:hypothetical protein
MRLFRILMGVLILLAALPALSMVAAETIARIYGCALDLAAPKPCMVGGEDIGQGLFTLGMMGWFLFATMPVLVTLVLAWILTELVYRHVHRRL